jgi:hypothetical protein
MTTNNPASSSSSSSSDKNGFRGFASKFRDQAKNVAAGNFKLPTFDDMAMKDDYIHSPEFNVRGGTGTRTGRSSSLRQQQEENSVVTNNGSTIDEASYYSTESSWSLLDRPSRTSTSRDLVQGVEKMMTTTTTVAQETTSTAMPEQKQSDVEHSKEIVRQSSIRSNIQYNRKTSTGSLLSVVSDALQPTTSVTPATTSGEYSRNPHHVVSDDDSDQSSEDDFDEEDPILSMIRKNYNNSNNNNNNYNNKGKNLGSDNNVPAAVITIKKSSNRFMEDLRLEAVQDQDVDAIAKFASSISTTETETTGSNNNNKKDDGPFGGYFKNAAVVQNFNRFVLRKGPNDQAAARLPPPLARERTKGKQPEDAFEITTSTSVGMLGDEDLEMLKQLKTKSAAGEASSSSSSVSILHNLRERRHFLFVTFTVLLCIYVYFRRAKTAESF